MITVQSTPTIAPIRTTLLSQLSKEVNSIHSISLYYNDNIDVMHICKPHLQKVYSMHKYIYLEIQF